METINSKKLSSMIPARVSPSVLEFQIRELERELEFERRENGKLRSRLVCADARIVAFEKLTERLALCIDAQVNVHSVISRPEPHWKNDETI